MVGVWVAAAVAGVMAVAALAAVVAGILAAAPQGRVALVAADMVVQHQGQEVARVTGLAAQAPASALAKGLKRVLQVQSKTTVIAVAALVQVVLRVMAVVARFQVALYLIGVAACCQVVAGVPGMAGQGQVVVEAPQLASQGPLLAAGMQLAGLGQLVAVQAGVILVAVWVLLLTMVAVLGAAPALGVAAWVSSLVTAPVVELLGVTARD